MKRIEYHGGTPASAEPVTYYVAPDGSDAGAGTIDSPWGNKHLIIDGNTVINACTGDEEIVGGTQQHISVSHSSNFEITNHTVYRGGKEGIDFKNGTHDGIISGNTVYDLSRLGIYIDGYREHT